MSSTPSLAEANTVNALNCLEIRGLNKSFLSGKERLHIIKGLDLDVPRGRIIGITGASGTGKSTLLHLIGGMDYPTSGKVLFNGINIYTLSKKQLANFRNQTIGFVFQFHHLLPEFTALENTMFPFLIRGMKRDQIKDKAQQSLLEVGLRDRLHHKAGDLSGGERQRVALARALVANPKLLLADEPTGNLDPKTAEYLFVLFLKLHIARNLTSVIVTHNEKLANICDEIFRLEDGKLVK